MTTLSLYAALDQARAALASFNVAALEADQLYLNPTRDYLLGSYPPLKAQSEVPEEVIYHALSDQLTLYLHVPFCNQHCVFCHFPKEINSRSPRVDRYVSAMRREIELTATRLTSKQAVTVYFGGGTPSYLSPAQITTVASAVTASFETNGSEITFELHPGLVRERNYRERLAAATQAGVNRWSLGAQSLDDSVLSRLNRGHTSSEIFAIITALQEIGPDNLCVDLMYGLPLQTNESWYRTLTLLIEIGIKKFSIYPLLFKTTDPITRQFALTPNIFPNEQQRLEMHLLAEAILSDSGYRHGPIYHWNKSGGHHSLQQVVRFDDIEQFNLVPFGAGSFGYMSDWQFTQLPDLDSYCECVEAGRKPVWRGAHVSRPERMRREIMFALRGSGLDRTLYKRKYSVSPEDAFPREFELLAKHALLAHEEDNRVKLTTKGFANAGAVSLLFFSDSVRHSILATEASIADRRRSTLEQLDYAPAVRDEGYESLKKLYTSSRSTTS